MRSLPQHRLDDTGKASIQCLNSVTEGSKGGKILVDS